MIFIKKRNVCSKMKNLKGFIHTKTVKKFISKNNKIVKKRSFFNIRKIQLYIILFCIIVFLLHIYSLYSNDIYFNDKKKNIILY